MPEEVRIWEIGSNDRLHEIQRSRLNLEVRIEEWIEQDISILSEDLLIIGRQVRTSYGLFIDLLCLASNGDLVIVELKRDQTPREVTAQVLDYASWVKDLSLEQITEIANSYLQQKYEQNLEESFEQKFGKELPEVLNDKHRMLIVASDVDSSSERIINYLSDTYGVSINVAKFQYFKNENGQELIARTFLLEPNRVEQSVQEKAPSKRKPNLSYEELQEVANQNGVGSLYKESVEGLFKNYFTRAEPTRSSIAFKKGSKVIFSLLPMSSSSESGLKFQIYATRFCECFSISLNQLNSLLPTNIDKWEYYKDAPPEWSGYEGFFVNQEAIEHFFSLKNTQSNE
jgi:Endonuclease NucS